MPEEGLELLELLLDCEEAEELEDVLHEEPGVRGVDGIELAFGPEVEHDLSAVEEPAEALGGGHEGITLKSCVGEPDGQVALVDASERYVDSSYVTSRDHSRHEAQRNEVAQHTDHGSQESAEWRRQQVKVEDLGDQHHSEELLDERRLRFDAQVNRSQQHRYDERDDTDDGQVYVLDLEGIGCPYRVVQDTEQDIVIGD